MYTFKVHIKVTSTIVFYIKKDERRRDGEHFTKYFFLNFNPAVNGNLVNIIHGTVVQFSIFISFLFF